MPNYEIVITRNGVARWQDADTGKFVKGLDGVSVNVGSYESGHVASTSSSRTGLFKRDITVTDVRDLFTRDELLYSSVQRLSHDVFSNWCNITARLENGKVNEDGTAKALALIQKLGVKQRLRQAFISRMVHGVSIVSLGFPGELNEPVLERDIQYVNTIPWPNIKDFLLDLRPDSETYGEVAGIKIDREEGSAIGEQSRMVEVVIHRDRFIPFVFPDLDASNPWGMSPLTPLHDIITVKKNVDWSLGETLFQFASGKFVAKVPTNMPDDKWEQFQEDFKDFNASTTFAARGEGFEIEGFGIQTSLDPEPYTRYFLSLATIGLGVPYATLLRGISGSAFDELIRTYAKDVRSMQMDDVEPVLVELLRRVLPSVRSWNIEWNSIIELDEEEKSFIKSRLSLGRSLTARAVDFFMSNGLSVEFDEDGWITRVFKQGGENDGMIAHPPVEPKPVQKPVVEEPAKPEPGEVEMEDGLMRQPVSD